MSTKKQAINSLTSLRGLSCLSVIIFHTHVDPTWSYAGGLGVQFFFVLSGFLLILRASNTILDGNISWPFLRAYFIRRIFRIYPPFIVALIFYASFYYSGLTYLWANPLYLYNIFGSKKGHLWTIRYELCYYFIMFPVAFCILAFMARQDIKKGSRYHKYLILGIGILILIGISFSLGISLFGWTDKLDRYWTFLFGTIAGIVSGVRRKYFSHISRSSYYAKRICTFLSWVLMVRIFFLSTYNAELYLHIPKNYWTQGEMMIAITFAILVVLLEFAEDEIWLGKALNAMVLIQIGESSYSTYLMHWWVVKLLLKKTNLGGSDLQYMAIFASLAVGHTVYIIVEDKCVKLGNKLIKKWKWDEKSSQTMLINPHHVSSDRKEIEAQDVTSDGKGIEDQGEPLEAAEVVIEAIEAKN